MIPIGKIVAAHGIRGGVKLKSYTEDPEAFQDYAPLFLADGTVLKLESFSAGPKDMFLATFQGIKDRNQADALRGKEIFIERDQLPETDEEEFYHVDLIGLKIMDEKGEFYGVVKMIQNYGAGDFLEIGMENGEEASLPFTQQAVPEISLSEGKLVIDPTYLVMVEKA